MDKKRAMKAVRAAQRAQKGEGFRGKYKGPDRFKGDKDKIKAWKAEGRIGAKYRAKNKKQAEVDKAARPERPGTAKPGQKVTMEYTPEQAEWDKKHGYPGNRKKGSKVKKDGTVYRGVGSKGKGKGKIRGKHLGWNHSERLREKIKGSDSGPRYGIDSVMDKSTDERRKKQKMDMYKKKKQQQTFENAAKRNQQTLEDTIRAQAAKS